MLDSRGGGGEGTYEEPGQVTGQVTGQVSRGGDFGRSAPPAEKRPALAGAGAGGGRSAISTTRSRSEHRRLDGPGDPVHSGFQGDGHGFASSCTAR